MQISKIISSIGQKFSLKNSSSKQDLVSFGISANHNGSDELISKSAAQALKSKYGADISFNGHYKNIQLQEKINSRMVSKDLYQYGSNGDVRLTSYEDHGFYYNGLTLTNVIKNYTQVPATEKNYWATIDGSKKQGYSNLSQQDAITEAIKNSPDHIKKSEIVYMRKPNSNSFAKVYFADPNEEITASKMDDPSINIIVKAPGSYFEREINTEYIH